MFLRETTARRTSGLYGFKFFTVFDSSPDFLNDFPESSTHLHFDQAHIIDFTG